MPKVNTDVDVVLSVARDFVSDEEYVTAKAAGVKRFNTAVYEIRTSTPTARVLDAMQRHIDIWDELRAAAVEENNWFVVIYCRTASIEMITTRNLVTRLLSRMVEDLSPEGENNGGN